MPQGEPGEGSGRVLVTGASGFIGRHCLTPLVQRGYEVHGVSSSGCTPLTASVRWHRVDLLDLAATGDLLAAVRPTHLLHLAWHPGMTGPSFQWLRAGVELLYRFQELGGRRVVVSGTCAEYDWSHGHCSEERTPTNPATTYGASKNALRHVLDVLCAQSGLSAAWARIFFVYGPHEPAGRLFPTVIDALGSGRTALCTEGRQRRDYLYVEDVAWALVMLVAGQFRGPVNVASGHAAPVRELASRLADRMGGLDRVDFGGRPTPASEAPLVVGDNAVLRSLGWRQLHSVEDGIDRTLIWWQEGRNG